MCTGAIQLLLTMGKQNQSHLFFCKSLKEGSARLIFDH